MNDSQTESPKPSKDLTDKLGAIGALQVIHELLNEGRFEGFKSQRILRSLEFVGNLHSQLLDECKAHPDAKLVNGLLPEEKKEEVIPSDKEVKKEEAPVPKIKQVLKKKGNKK